MNEKPATHSRGPWFPADRWVGPEVDDVETDRVAFTTLFGYTRHIAHIFQGEGGVGSPQALAEQKANMALICAAPELLQVCRECAEYWRDTDAPIGARLREAIAKATGGAE